ncbi:MAG: GNAT family N-acetyltransferase [Deltaproteobacteria bacterium]|nr:GNAT family N-acetyltransferase [Deltaproteobacteria bacterium]
MSEIICREISSEDERVQCMRIRQKVFVEEQKLFKVSEKDAHDKHAIHICALHDNTVIGTVRIYHEKQHEWWGGRLAVKKGFRGRAGKLLVQAAVSFVRRLGGRHLYAHVQKKNVSFFKGLAWQLRGDVFEQQGKPHQLMEKVL